MLRIVRYGNSRFWALYDGQDLVVVTVYKRGAREVQRRLAAQPRATAEAAAAEAAQAAAARQARALAQPARQPSLAAPPGPAGRRRDQRERPGYPPVVFPFMPLVGQQRATCLRSRHFPLSLEACAVKAAQRRVREGSLDRRSRRRG
jgi:plasmid stabilization system protein ParE